ncbi:MAG: hypothetical protein M3134_12125 [Actinomycetota bacterium]|nr:hypothetical protein [Actinomycetota bacterium]
MNRRALVRATVLVWGSTVLAAIVVAAVPEAAADARDLLDFRLVEPASGTFWDAATYFTTNARVIAAVLLAGWARPQSEHAAPVLDVLVIGVVATNAGLVGVAAAAYGEAMVTRLAHLPAEWSALVIATSTYLQRRRTGRGSLKAAALSATLLLALAAAIETWLT